MSDAYVDDRTQNEKAANHVEFQAWMAILPPAVAKVCEGPKRRRKAGR